MVKSSVGEALEACSRASRAAIGQAARWRRLNFHKNQLEIQIRLPDDRSSAAEGQFARRGRRAQMWHLVWVRGREGPSGGLAGAPDPAGAH